MRGACVSALRRAREPRNLAAVDRGRGWRCEEEAGDQLPTSVSGHLRKKHEEEDCQVIMITNQGMLKVNKEDFLPAKKM